VVTKVSSTIVARDEVVADLVHRLESAGSQGPSLVVLSGEPGVGRTAVLERLAAEAPGRVLRARAVPWESGEPCALVRMLVPDLVPGDSIFDTAAVVARSVSGAGEPTLVVVDDAEHADPESLQVLATAARHHRDGRFLVVLDRSTPPWGHTERCPDRVEVEAAADLVLELQPLGPADVGALATSRGTPLHPALAEHLWRHTGGIPRHVVDLLDHLPPETWAGNAPALPAPARVASATGELLDTLSAAARALVEAVCILEAPVRLADAVAVAALDDAVTALDEAERCGLVTLAERPGSPVLLQPQDAMVRAAVLAGMGPGRRSRMHRRASVTVDDEVAALVHSVAASPLPDAGVAERLDDLARSRSEGGEWAATAELLTLASRVTSDPELREQRLVRAVDALVGAGDVPAAVGYLAEVESVRETPMRNAVLGYLAILRGRPLEADTRLSRAWQLVNPGREPQTAALVCQRHVLHHLARCDGESLVRWADRAVELAGPDDPAAVEASAIRGLGLASTGHIAEAFESYRMVGDRVSHGAVVQRVQMGSGWLHLVTDEVDLALTELETAVPTDFLGGSTRISLWAQAWLARTYFVTGEWDAALRTALAALDLAARTGTSLLVPLLRWTVTQVLALRGDWQSAEHSLREGDAPANAYAVMRVPAALARASVAEAGADYDGVLRALAPLTQPWARGDVAEPGFWPWPDVYANALVLKGRYAEARTFLTEHERRALARGHRSAQARLAYARGRLHGALGDIDAARASFEGALALLEPLPLVHDRARVNFSYGQTLRRAGKRREADAVIAAAREAYLSLGAETYVRRCDRELKAGGVHAVPSERAADSLTPQEEAVAGLIASGMTNREAAAELYLSVKTVQFHLTRVYAKLGIRSRSELAAVRREPLDE
jgi:DNA-binding CsgD family transcriptional regulator